MAGNKLKRCLFRVWSGMLDLRDECKSENLVAKARRQFLR